jgi:hypothetical protein
VATLGLIALLADSFHSAVEIPGGGFSL